MKSWWWSFSVIVCVVAVTGGEPAPAVAMAGMDMTQARYLGKPDLPLTSAMIAAGGGAQDFSSVRLSEMLTAQHSKAEVAHLNARFGAARMHRFFTTFDAFIGAAIADVRYRHVTLPQPNAALAHNPYELAASLRAAGVMPDGRFDVGYFIEHLVSRPVHKHVMDVANASSAIGPAANADFHVILTAEMDDLKSLYRLPQ